MRLYLLTVTDMIFDNDSEVFNDTFTNNQWPVPWWWLSNVHDSDEDSNNNDTDFNSSDKTWKTAYMTLMTAIMTSSEVKLTD